VNGKLANGKPILARRQGFARQTCLEGKVALAYRPPHWAPLAHGHASRGAAASTHRPHRAVTTKGVDMRTTTVKRTIATALSGVAIAGIPGAPAASAMPPTEPGSTSGDPGTTEIVAPTPRANPTPDAGLDLSSAAIGAASGSGLLIVVLAAGGLAWRRSVARPHGATRA
jgi:hypothetical protein